MYLKEYTDMFWTGHRSLETFDWMCFLVGLPLCDELHRGIILKIPETFEEQEITSVLTKQ